MRLLDCVISSAPPAARSANGNLRPASCLAPPACPEVRPTITARKAGTKPLSHPARSRFQSAEFLYCPSNLTPGITRRPGPMKVDDKQRVGGRVHAVVRCGGRCYELLQSYYFNKKSKVVRSITSSNVAQPILLSCGLVSLCNLRPLASLCLRDSGAHAS